MRFTYKGLKAEYQKHTVTEEEVTRYMQRLQQQNPRVAEVCDRPTENGDEVVLDYAGFCNGEQFEGGTASGQTLVLGSGMFIPGFEEQLLDKVPGEEVTVKVTFPEAYHAENLAGKAAEFKCKIQQIRVKTQYELDDTFAKEVGGCQSYAEMQEKVRQSLQDFTDQRGEMDLAEQLLSQAAQTLDYTPSEEEIQDAVEEQMQELHNQLAQQGLSVEMYLQFMNTTLEALQEEAKPTAIATLRNNAAVDKIAELEGLEATKEDIAKALAVICQRNNMTMDDLKPHYNEAFEQTIVKSILAGKVMQLIRAAADVTVV